MKSSNQDFYSSLMMEMSNHGSTASWWLYCTVSDAMPTEYAHRALRKAGIPTADAEIAKDQRLQINAVKAMIKSAKPLQLNRIASHLMSRWQELL